MRIIAGKAKSLPLKTIPGSETRPTTDRIKETLFNIIQHSVAEARVLDLFSGSGSIGLEALSRGAKEAVFVESNRKAAACIDENIKFTKFTAESHLLNTDVLLALKRLEGGAAFDIVFMDPPYDQSLEREVLEYLSTSSIIQNNTLIIVEASLGTDFSYLEELGYQLQKEKKYKKNLHVFIEKQALGGTK